eukprot:snap_masked-scaffold_59-processed-gene-0.22-mRNA-1 protein AED:1.00 eAED:1.00 QI:0/-1/0/0/-1/1/1/0/63
MVRSSGPPFDGSRRKTFYYSLKDVKVCRKKTQTDLYSKVFLTRNKPFRLLSHEYKIVCRNEKI